MIVLVLVMAACGSDTTDVAGFPDVTTGPTSPVGGTPASTSSTPAPPTSTLVAETPPVAPSTAAEPSEEDMAVFIATMEDSLAGTAYEGDASNEPELFLATGWLFCDWLDEGDTPDEALTRYLEELAGGVDSAKDDQLVLAGALLGAAVSVLCPIHAALVG